MLTKNREMTLEEWCDKLPESHRAKRELRELKFDEIKFLKKTIRAYNRMLMCYRAGGKLPEWVLDHLRKAEQKYGDLSKI